MAVGFAVAHGAKVWHLPVSDWLRLVGAWGIATVLLNGGTLALNTAYDRDEGDIGYLFNPPPIPRYLANFALLLMLAGVGLSALLGWRFLVVCAVCFCMSLLYSVPPLRLKARAGYDLLINCMGYGVLTFFAGYAATGKPVLLPVLLACAGYFLLYVCFYPLTQFYQCEEDLRHGDRTLTVALGKKLLLWTSFVGLLAAFGFFAWHAFELKLGYRSLGLAVAFLLWCGVVIPWLVRQER
jgi:4-hydroxybenzoate polyprenyltransferase